MIEANLKLMNTFDDHGMQEFLHRHPLKDGEIVELQQKVACPLFVPPEVPLCISSDKPRISLHTSAIAIECGLSHSKLRRPEESRGWARTYVPPS